MESFKELFEAVAQSDIKKAIKKTDFGTLMPQAFSVEFFNTDAGMGGEKLHRVTAHNLRPKDQADVELLKKELSKKFNVTDKSEKDSLMLIIRKK